MSYAYDPQFRLGGFFPENAHNTSQFPTREASTAVGTNLACIMLGCLCVDIPSGTSVSIAYGGELAP